MFARNIVTADVLETIEAGEVIADYPTDKPYPSCLLLKFVKERPLHVVLAFDVADGICILVTAYEPDPILWEADFKQKR